MAQYLCENAEFTIEFHRQDWIYKGVSDVQYVDLRLCWLHNVHMFRELLEIMDYIKQNNLCAEALMLLNVSTAVLPDQQVGGDL